MDKEVYEQIVEDYNEAKKMQQSYKKLLEKKELLEQDEKVKEYIEILQLMKDYNKSTLDKSNRELITDLFNKNVNKSKSTNDIYVYIGTYEYATGINIKGTIDKAVDRDDPNADYRLYINLEKFLDTKQIAISEADEFEKTNTVIYAENRNEYRELQYEFIKYSIELGQEKAIQKIIKK